MSTHSNKALYKNNKNWTFVYVHIIPDINIHDIFFSIGSRQSIEESLKKHYS